MIESNSSKLPWREGKNWSYTVKSGDTLAKVADFFDVTVDQLKQYNKPTLGLDNRFDAGIILRNPNEIPMLVNIAMQNGANIKQVASVLQITEDEAQKIYSLDAVEPLQSKEIVPFGEEFDAVISEEASALLDTLAEETEEPAPVISEEALKQIEVLAQYMEPEDFSMIRPDGSRKSAKGFLGPITDAEGRTMTEFSIGVPINGKETDIPTLVPGLNSQEIAAIRTGTVPDSARIKAIQHAEARIAEGLSPFYQDGEEYTDYKSAMDQRLAEVTPTGERVGPELFPVTAKGQRIEPELFPVKPTGERIGPELFPAVAKGERIGPELFPITPTGERRQPGLFPVTAKGQRIGPELFPITVSAQRREQDLQEQPRSDGPVISQEAMDLFAAIEKRDAEDAIGAWRNIAKGLSFSAFDELEAFVASQVNDTPYVIEKARIKEEMDEYSLYNPVASMAQETLGLIPGGLVSTKALEAMGVIRLPAQGAIETGVYGFNSGETAEERFILGTSSAVLGGVVGKAFEVVFDPKLIAKAGDAETLKTLQTNAMQSKVTEQKIAMAPANMTDDQLIDQLLIRETEFLADIIGRQGARPEEVGNTLRRLSGFAQNMGVNQQQINRVLNSKQLRELTKLPDDIFTDPKALNAFREDLLDKTVGRLGVDVGMTIPEAQSSIIKLRRLASPLATLAEKVVGPAFSNRIIRGMNRVVRQQADLDEIWKGMEGLRNLADDVKFNDLLLDAVNATNIGGKAAAKALQQAKKYADKKIGKGAGDRLQKFFDDGLAFNSRYRRQVTAGELSPIWMHSSTKQMSEDISLRVNRQRAAGKTDDAASKDRLRRSMEDERALPPEKQREYENIFDSHWRWQRETLTRMELGEQLGLRTSGKPIFTESYEDLPKSLQRAVDNEKMTLLEASVYNTLTPAFKKKVDAKKLTVFDAASQMETKTYKLFDEKVITEALRREGYSDVQIKNAIEILDDLGVNAQRGMSKELDIVRSLGYVGTIANPYGALMNVHDLFNAAFEFGVGNVLKAVFAKDGINFTAQEMGLAQQIYGEFVRRVSRGDKSLGIEFLDKIAQGSADLLDWSMKASGFAGLDKYAKGKIMSAAFRKAKQEIDAGTFATKWKDTFSRAELDQLQRDIASNNLQSELVRDLVMFDLFRLQPINAAAQTSFGLANPNARLFYMLKGFAIKQFDLMERRIFSEWKKGNKKQALENAMKYLVVSGGGYGVVNEARQILKGEAPDPEEAAVGALYQIGSVLTFGAMGANDYGYAKFMEDPANAMLVNIMPPLSATLPAAVLKDVAEVFSKGDPLPDETFYSLPLVGKGLEAIFE